jgi:hypothetical protein
MPARRTFHEPPIKCHCGGDAFTLSEKTDFRIPRFIMPFFAVKNNGFG